MNRSAHGSIKSAATVRLSKSFQSKMDKMSERLYDIVKSGFMIKRAQNKKRFTPVNYKQRWFELTKRTLSYFDVESVEVSNYCYHFYEDYYYFYYIILVMLNACMQIPASVEKHSQRKLNFLLK